MVSALLLNEVIVVHFDEVLVSVLHIDTGTVFTSKLDGMTVVSLDENMVSVLLLNGVALLLLLGKDTVVFVSAVVMLLGCEEDTVM